MRTGRRMDERSVAGAVWRPDRHLGLGDGLRGERRTSGGGETGSHGQRDEIAPRGIGHGLIQFFGILFVIHRCLSPLSKSFSPEFRISTLSLRKTICQLRD